MANISVNLLPKEIILQRQQSAKLLLVNKLSIIALLTLVFFTSSTLAIRIMQNAGLQGAERSQAFAEERVKGLQDKEGQAVMLKERLNSISTLLGGDVKRKTIFNLIVFLTPENLQITDALVDKEGNMTVSFTGLSLPSIQTLIANLKSKEKTSDMLAKVSLDGLSSGRDSTYRFILKVVPK